MSEDIKIEFTNIENASEVVKLFSIGDNPYKWSIDKWKHYYIDYPYANPIGIIAKINDEIVGHYGLLPVMIGEWRALLGVHAYVKESCRNLRVISKLLKQVDEYARQEKYSLICGFSNHEFSKVLNVVFKWKTIGFLNFDTKDSVILEEKTKYLYKFIYTDKWYQWKFESLKDSYTKKYIKDNTIYCQLIKTRRQDKNLDMRHLGKLNFWNPDKYTKEDTTNWSQPFLIKKIDENLPDSIYDIKNWYIEMGDSDTFEI